MAMKAHEPIKFDERLKENIKSTMSYAQSVCEKTLTFQKYRKTVEALSCFYETSLDFSYDGLYVDLRVWEFKDAEPAFRFLEMNGIIFKDSSEQAEWRTRTFHAGDFKVRLRTTEDTKNCKRVQIGTREVPVYRMECDEPKGETL